MGWFDISKNSAHASSQLGALPMDFCLVVAGKGMEAMERRRNGASFAISQASKSPVLECFDMSKLILLATCRQKGTMGHAVPSPSFISGCCSFQLGAEESERLPDQFESELHLRRLGPCRGVLPGWCFCHRIALRCIWHPPCGPVPGMCFF